MKDTGNTMECGACGKPISLTAKFCGKCGAPVKRPAPVVAEETSDAPLLQATLAELPVSTESVSDTGKEVQDLVLSLETPQPPAQHTSMLNIDLDDMWEKHKVKVQERRYADSTIKSKSTLDNDEPTPE